MIYQFRNFRITEIRTVAGEDGILTRIHGSSDLTKAIAEKMGWEVMHSEDGVLEGISSAKLSGELNLSNLSLIPNGDLKSSQIEKLPASIARGFQIVISGGDEESAADTGLKFVITAPATSAKRLVEYHLKVGRADAVLKLDVVGDSQMKLGEEEGAEDPVDEETEAKKKRKAAAEAGVPFA